MNDGSNAPISDDGVLLPGEPGCPKPAETASLRHEVTLQRHLDHLAATVLEMGAVCERSVRDAFQAVVRGDQDLAYAVIIRDKRIDALESDLRQECLRFLLHHQPAGGLLRFAYGLIRTSLGLERVGDYAESIARQALRLGGNLNDVPVAGLQRIADLSAGMLRDAVHAFASQNAPQARATMVVEETVDVFRSELNQELLQLFRNGKLDWDRLHALMTVARRLERVSDQARSLCLDTIYACTGEDLKHPRANLLRVLFLDQHHSSLSRLAEFIGSSLKEPECVFVSAGIAPRPLAPRAVQYLKAQGCDPSGPPPTGLAGLPSLAGFDVVVTLDREAWKALPELPRRVFCLQWSVQDPEVVMGSEVEYQAACEACQRFLSEHIPSLVKAILGENRRDEAATLQAQAPPER